MASEPLKSGCQSSTVKDAPLVPILVLKLPVLGLGPSSLPSSEGGTLVVFVVFDPFLAAQDTGELSSTGGTGTPLEAGGVCGVNLDAIGGTTGFELIVDVRRVVEALEGGRLVAEIEDPPVPERDCVLVMELLSSLSASLFCC